MAEEVVIQTGARLHFGLLANTPELPRTFGGAGAMLGGVGFKVRARISTEDFVLGDDHASRRAAAFLAAYRHRCPDGLQAPRCTLEVLETIPAHVGLGSGTQLGMAVAKALAILANDQTSTATDLANYVGRGLRSGLGIHGFQAGGFLVEGGKNNNEQIAPLVCRVVIPESWRFLLARPRKVCGLSGAAESTALARLQPMPSRTTEHLCRLLLLEILPAIVEADFEVCSSSLHEFGTVVGEYFAPLQGGVYAHQRMSQLADELERRGIFGVGQTSWGPSLFALCSDGETATALLHELRSSSQWDDCDLNVSQPLNEGATVCVA